MNFIGWVVVYVLFAWLFGFWPFEEGMISGPSSGCTYDAGYEEGYDGANPKCSNEAYREGYAEGDFDADCHWYRCVRPDHDKFKQLECGSWSRMTC